MSESRPEKLGRFISFLILFPLFNSNRPARRATDGKICLSSVYNSVALIRGMFSATQMIV